MLHCDIGLEKIDTRMRRLSLDITVAINRDKKTLQYPHTERQRYNILEMALCVKFQIF